MQIRICMQCIKWSPCDMSRVDDHTLPACRAGDVLLNHNLTTFHSRTTWEDGDDDTQKRHMLRMWLASPLGW